MSLRRRLERLEAEYSDSSARRSTCPECGFDPEGANLQVEWEDPSPEEYVAWLKDFYERGCLPHEAEHRGQPKSPCPNCGAQVVIVDWDDADRAKMFRRECERLKACNWDVETFFASQTGKPSNQVPDYPPSSWSGGSSPNGRS